MNGKAEDSVVGDIKHDENTLRILVVTDIHLGYMEKDAIRGNDSLNTFEEILKIAEREDVDFILNGGDLFHDNKPSRRTLHGCMTLMRKYCFGDKPCSVEYLSDQSVDYGHTPFPVVNYEDPNLNVSIPFFSIHGNHDDPAGQGTLCSLDLLSTAGLANFFGRYTSLEKIEIRPVLLKKGSTQLALYGLGSVRDERLHRMFVNKDVTMLRPRENQGQWFNLFVIHQNRSKHGPTNYIPEQFLEDFLDLVIWGHEHECRLKPEWNSQEFYISQPGSSIATSLSEGETREKHIGLLSIRGKEFKMKQIRLHTVRQFYFKDVALRDTTINPDQPNQKKKIELYLTDLVNEIIEKAEMERIGNSLIPTQPLVRLRVDYTGGFEPLSIVRFGQQFVNRVANPRDILLATSRRIGQADTKPGVGESAQQFVPDEGLDIGRVEDMVRKHLLSVDQNQRLCLLTERGMGEAVKEYVDKEENVAIEELVKHQLAKTQDHLMQLNIHEDLIEQEIAIFKQKKKVSVEDEEFDEAMRNARQRHDRTASQPSDDESLIEDDEKPTTSTSTRGRGSRGRGRGRGRGAKSSPAVTKKPRTSAQWDSDEEVSVVSSSQASSRTSQRSRKGQIKYSDLSDDDVVDIPVRKRRR